jgi:hypothetical protein
VVTSLTGSALLALSAVLAWAVVPFFQSGTDQPVYPTSLTLPGLILGGSSGPQPRLGLVLVVLAVATAFLVVVGPTRRSLDLFRRALGVVALALAILFVVRFGEVTQGADQRFRPPAGLRAGIYVCVAGAALTIAAGRRLRPAEPPRPLGAGDDPARSSA